MPPELTGEALRVFGHAADEQRAAVSPNEVEAIIEFRTLKAFLAREHLVNEVDATCGEVID